MRDCWYGYFLLQCGASLSVSVSLDCMQSWIHWLYSAAILVTQLTTPYIRIAPAAGDNQLTGQTRSFLHILWPSQLFCSQLGGFTHYVFNVAAVMTIPSIEKQIHKNIACVWFCLLSCYLRRISVIKSETHRRCLLPSSSQHYWTWKTCLRCDCHLMCQCWRFLAGVNPFSWIFLIISGRLSWFVLVAAVVTTVNTQKDAKVLKVKIWSVFKRCSI